MNEPSIDGAVFLIWVAVLAAICVAFYIARLAGPWPFRRPPLRHPVAEPDGAGSPPVGPEAAVTHPAVTGLLHRCSHAELLAWNDTEVSLLRTVALIDATCAALAVVSVAGWLLGGWPHSTLVPVGLAAVVAAAVEVTVRRRRPIRRAIRWEMERRTALMLAAHDEAMALVRDRNLALLRQVGIEVADPFCVEWEPRMEEET